MLFLLAFRSPLLLPFDLFPFLHGETFSPLIHGTPVKNRGLRHLLFVCFALYKVEQTKQTCSSKEPRFVISFCLLPPPPPPPGLDKAVVRDAAAVSTSLSSPSPATHRH
ncbi:hypothetical protein OPV22_010574 [Ensete ventricosum]|uniref:Secreted protein n=1 Tax=Ensete ventricosum TaxID=4639 RepID=A0AAV8RH37_ENSVE|nr:hypothetical protein OPV22_010574 [Ensete ventricosum]